MEAAADLGGGFAASQGVVGMGGVEARRPAASRRSPRRPETSKLWAICQVSSTAAGSLRRRSRP